MLDFPFFSSILFPFHTSSFPSWPVRRLLHRGLEVWLILWRRPTSQPLCKRLLPRGLRTVHQHLFLSHISFFFCKRNSRGKGDVMVDGPEVQRFVVEKTSIGWKNSSGKRQVADGLKPTLQRAHLKATLFSRKVCFSTCWIFPHQIFIFPFLWFLLFFSKEKEKQPKERER